MPRRPRLEAPGATHHVVANAVAGQELVRDDHDRRALWARLGRTVKRYRWSCLVYCFLDTHFHLLVETPEPNLGEGMQWLCGRYGQEFNLRYSRRGALFGQRYYSELVRSDRHLASAIVYVLLNPVRAGIVRQPEDWQWSSYAATVGLEDAPSFLDVGGVLEVIDRRPDVARRSLEEAVHETLSEDERARRAEVGAVF
jgi:REP element-mobilizing transposase RayT